MKQEFGPDCRFIRCLGKSERTVAVGMSVDTVVVQELGDVLLLREVGAPLLTNNHSSTSGTLPANNAVPLQSSGHRKGWVNCGSFRSYSVRSAQSRIFCLRSISKNARENGHARFFHRQRARTTSTRVGPLPPHLVQAGRTPRLRSSRVALTTKVSTVSGITKNSKKVRYWGRLGSPAASSSR